MKALTVPADTRRAPQDAQAAGPHPAVPEVAPDGQAAALLERLEQVVAAELGSLRAGAEPLLAEVRQSLAALEPGPEGVRLPPKEQQALRGQLGKKLDELEDVLEALLLAARPEGGRPLGER